MAFEVGASTGRIFDANPKGKRPYTRRPIYMHSPGVGTQPAIKIAPAVRAGTQPYQHSPGVGTQPSPSVVTPQAATPVTPAPTTHAAAAPAAPPGLIAQRLIQYISSIQDPNERAYIQNQLMPQVIQLQTQQETINNVAQAQMSAISALTSQLGGALAGLGGSGIGYGKISGVQKGSGKAENAAMDKANPNAGTQAILSAIGAPSEQAAQITQQNQDVFGAGGDVLQGLGGDIPAWATDLVGKATANYWSAQPAVADAYGAQETQKVQLDQQSQLMDVNKSLNEMLLGIPAITSDYDKQQYQMQQDRQDRAIQLYNMGLLSQRQLAEVMGLPNASAYPNQPKQDPASTPSLVRYTDPATGRTMLFNPANGKAIVLPGQGVKPASSSSMPKPPSTFGTESTGYYTWQQTKTGWKPVMVIPPVKPGTKATAKAGPIQTMTLPNGNQAVGQFLPDGSWKTISIVSKGNNPQKPQIIGAGGVPMTNSQINEAGATVKTSIASARRQGIPLQQVIDTFENEGIPAEIYAPLIGRAYGIPSTLPKNLGSLSVQQLYRVAVLYGYRPPIAKKTTIYGVDALGRQRPLSPKILASIAQKGVKNNPDLPSWLTSIKRVDGAGRPAGGLGKTGLVGWIRQHIPKADAVAEPAAVDVAKWVKVPAGVDRPGVSTHPQVLGFVARIAQVHGSPLTIGTGTRHRQYVAGEGNTQSAHWTGWAVDIPIGGGSPGHPDPRLTKLGQDALIAAGMPEAQARKVTHWDGGDYNGYNILFNTNVGGNHFNHLHVGLRATRQTVADSGDYPAINTVARQNPASVQKINTFLQQRGSPMAGLGGIFVAAGKKYGVDPALLVAIAGAESSFGTYGPIQSIHNPFGWGPNISFPSWQAAIFRVAKGLRDGYLRQGLTSIEDIARKWAPIGAGNDPSNLNSNWVTNVRNYYNAILGQ